MDVLKNLISEILSNIESFFNILHSILTIIAIIVGGWWTYHRFIRQRDNFPLIEFSADVVFHSKIKDYWIVELIAYVENKGKVRHEIYDFRFDLASIENNDNTILSPQYGNQVLFPHNLVKGNYLPTNTMYFFVDPGVKSKFSHVTRVHKNTNAVIFHTYFKYTDEKFAHTAEATKKVPAE